jgi:D-alanyl-D-alanine dipeptidase
MRPTLPALSLLIACSVAAAADELVNVVRLDPTIVVEMKYATDRNFMHQVLYDRPLCLLRRPVAQRLVRVQAALAPRGLGLKVWDAYRPHSVQKKMWTIKPDARFVAPPYKGSKPGRGAAVDLTLVDRQGRELDMGTDHDEFSTRAAPESPDVSEAARRNRRILRDAMAAEGFSQLSSEWWHFDGPGSAGYPIMDVPLTDPVRR